MAFYSDVDISFDADPQSGDLKVLTDSRAIAQAVKNLVLTSVFEKPFQPSIGGNIYALLFENFNSVTRLVVAERIREVVDLYEPRAKVQYVDIYEDKGPTGVKLDANEIVVVVGFYAYNIPTLVTTDILLRRLR